MAGKQGTLAFRNPDQKVLWDCELMGQISDGQWENAMPQDHWEAWSRAETIVDPEDVGRDFTVKKDGYGFTRKEFIDCDFSGDGTYRLSDRAMGYVRVARTFGYDKDVRSIADYGDRTDGYLPDHISAETRSIIEQGRERITAVVEDASIYDHAALMADLRDISKVIKRVRGADESGETFVRKDGNRRDTIHLPSCSAALRGREYGNRDMTRSGVVDTINGRYFRVDLHDCITGDIRTGLYQSAREKKEAEQREAQRRDALIDAAVATVARDKLVAKIGKMTDEEARLFAEYVSQIGDGYFTPHGVRDLREVAIKSASIFYVEP